MCVKVKNIYQNIDEIKSILLLNIGVNLNNECIGNIGAAIIAEGLNRSKKLAYLHLGKY